MNLKIVARVIKHGAEIGAETIHVTWPAVQVALDLEQPRQRLPIPALLSPRLSGTICGERQRFRCG